MEQIDLFKPIVVDNTQLRNKEKHKHLYRESSHKEHSCKQEWLSLTACCICVICCMYAVWTNENLRDFKNKLKEVQEKCNSCVESRTDTGFINGITKENIGRFLRSCVSSKNKETKENEVKARLVKNNENNLQQKIVPYQQKRSDKKNTIETRDKFPVLEVVRNYVTSQRIKRNAPQIKASHTENAKGNNEKRRRKCRRRNNCKKGQKSDKRRNKRKGPKGDTGPKGDRGEKGPRGPKGDTGPKGNMGEIGLRGPKGDRGLQGDPGVRGLDGAKGDIGQTGLQGPQGLPGVKGDTGKPCATMAAHFVSDFWKSSNIEEFGGRFSLTECISKWDGKICRNRTYRSDNEPQSLKFLVPASWSDEVESPLEVSSNGVYTAKITGLYLVYSHTVFYDDSHKEAMAIVLRRVNHGQKTQLKCVEGIDAPYKPSTQINAKFKTCSITGVLYINKGDNLEVQILFKNTVLDLTKDVTYFGVALLSSSEGIK